MSTTELILPWYHRIRHVDLKKIEHPTSLLDFQKLSYIEGYDSRYFEYLNLSNKKLSTNWLDSWESIFAVGPFIKRERKYYKIPFIVFIAKGSIYSQLVVLSKRLELPYYEFGIMPDLHIYPSKLHEYFIMKKDKLWLRTEAVSIRLKRGG